MSPKYLAGFLVLSCVASAATAGPSRAERELVEIKAALMSADYRGDISNLAALRSRALQLSDDPKLGYLADYWSGFASWRIVVNNNDGKIPPAEAMAHLTRAAADFESSLRKKDDFADAWAGAAAVHGWLAAYKHSDEAAMNTEVETFKRLLNRALELEPSNPRVLWVQATPSIVLPPERGGNIDRAIELYRKMVDNARPLTPESPLPDWGKAEGLMSLANAHLKKSEVQAAADEAGAALHLQPEWHYLRDILLPQIHQHDFDYLLGDWEFTATNQQYGKFRGYWSAARLDDANIIDEYRVVGDGGETYYVTRTLRAYNARQKQWELVSTEKGSGLQNLGTGQREGAEVHIEQKFGAGTDNPSLLRIRYYDIHPDRFSWAADRSADGGKTWIKNFQSIEAHRIGPSRSLALTNATATSSKP